MQSKPPIVEGGKGWPSPYDDWECKPLAVCDPDAAVE